MTLGEKIYYLRKKKGFSQEQVAEKIGVSRQTVSKWETNQALPELIKGKLLAELFNVSYDNLVDGSTESIDLTSMDVLSDSIDWTSAWAEKYPILKEYQKKQAAELYSKKVTKLYEELKEELALNELDAFLVMKDMLYQRYHNFIRKNNHSE